MILVTGGAGFIGSNFVAALNARGESDIAVCDMLGTGDKWRNLAKAGFADFVAPDALPGWLARGDRIEAVIHMGAISATTATDGDEVIRTNFNLSLALLDHCTAAGIPFLYASSAAVYGDGEQGFADAVELEAVTRLRPLNLYGWSKRQFDLVVAERIARGRPLPPACIGLRFFNVYGPNEYHKGDMMSIVAKIAAPIGRGERISLFRSHRDDIGDGDQRRDFIYVDDAVTMSLALLDGRAPAGFYNIGTGRARSFRELAEAVFRAYGRPPAIDYIDIPESIREKYQYFTQAPLDRLGAAGVSAETAPMEGSVADYVGRYLQRTDPYR